MFKLFKNVCIYRLSRQIDNLSHSALAAVMSDHPFTHCNPQESIRSGWLINDDNTPQVLAFKQFLLITKQTETRDVPKDTLNDELRKRVAEHQDKTGSRVNRTEKGALRDEIFRSLLPRAFARTAFTQILIDTEQGLIYIDTASPRTAESALALLRKTLGSLPVVPVMSKTPPELTMTAWAKDGFADMPHALALDEKKITFEHVLSQGQKASFSNFSGTDFAATLASNNNNVTSVSLILSTPFEMACVLTSDCELRRLSFSDALNEKAMEQAGEDNGESEPEELSRLRSHATFILMTEELSKGFEIVMAALGGEYPLSGASKATSE